MNAANNLAPVCQVVINMMHGAKRGKDQPYNRASVRAAFSHAVLSFSKQGKLPLLKEAIEAYCDTGVCVAKHVNGMRLLRQYHEKIGITAEDNVERALYGDILFALRELLETGMIRPRCSRTAQAPRISKQVKVVENGTAIWQVKIDASKINTLREWHGVTDEFVQKILTTPNGVIKVPAVVEA
jgi:hypothetical protein